MNGYAPRLRQKYQEKVVGALLTEFSYGNVMEVPRLEKVVINLTTKEAIQNVKLLETAVEAQDDSLRSRQCFLLARGGLEDDGVRVRVGEPLEA